jgi:hypothetical protein
VSARDSAARLFARYVASVTDGLPENGLPRNVRYAAALFEALAAYGMNYVIDPASSFTELSGDASALDSLNYPYQTLYYRGGDCDDLSILYCALLEALEVDTAFITIPGHIYMAFDTGIENGMAFNTGTENSAVFAAGQDDVIAHGGRLWMPVEVTVPHEGFYRAWRIGAREWRAALDGSLSGAGRQLYPMRESWTLYPPVTVPEAGDRPPALPEKGEIERRFGKASEMLKRQVQPPEYPAAPGMAGP